MLPGTLGSRIIRVLADGRGLRVWWIWSQAVSPGAGPPPRGSSGLSGRCSASRWRLQSHRHCRNVALTRIVENFADAIGVMALDIALGTRPLQQLPLVVTN